MGSYLEVEMWARHIAGGPDIADYSAGRDLASLLFEAGQVGVQRHRAVAVPDLDPVAVRAAVPSRLDDRPGPDRPDGRAHGCGEVETVMGGGPVVSLLAEPSGQVVFLYG